MYLSRRFLPLFTAQFLGAFNDNLFRTAIVTLVTYRIASIEPSTRELLVVIALGLFMLPFFLLSATAGKLADRMDKSHIILYVKFLEVPIMILAMLGFIMQSPYMLLFTLFLTGIHSAFFGPAKYGILPELVKPQDLLGANSAFVASTFIAILLGSTLGAQVIHAGAYGHYYISGLLILFAAAGFFASVFIPSTPKQAPGLALHPNIFKETWQIMSRASLEKRIFKHILFVAWFWFCGASILAMLPNLAKHSLSANVNVFTVMLVMFSLGIAGGAMLCRWLLKNHISARLVPLASLLMTAFIVDLGLACSADFFHTSKLLTLNDFLTHPHGLRVMADLLMLAVCGGLYAVPLYSWVQRHAKPAYRAQMIAAMNIYNSGAAVLASVAATALIAAGIDHPHQLMLLGIGQIGITWLAWENLRDRGQRNLFGT